MIFIDKPTPIGKWCNECSSKEDVLSISVEGDGRRSSVPLCRSCRAGLALLLQPDMLAELREKVDGNLRREWEHIDGAHFVIDDVLTAIDDLAKTKKGEADA